MKNFNDVFYAMNFVSDRASLAAADVILDFYIKKNVAKIVNQKGKYLWIKLKNSIKKNIYIN